MKSFIYTLIRYFLVGILIAVCVVCMFGILYFYQTKMAIIPAIIGGASFMGCLAITTKE